MATSSTIPATETILFTRGVPPTEVLPAEQMAECFEAVVRRDPVGVLQYGQAAGYAPLRKLLAKEYDISEDEIFVSNGSLQLMDLLGAHLIKPGSSVLVEQPSYDRAITSFSRRGAHVISIPMEHDGINMERLEAQLKRQVPAFMYLIPDFQNPSGITLSLEKRKHLLELAGQYEFWIIEDVPYRLLRYRGESLPILREINPEHVVTMSSYSKLVAPALRVGHLAAPAKMVAALAKLGEDTYLSPTLPAQAMLYEFLNRGLLAPNIEKLCEMYTPRWRAMIAAVKKHLPGVSMAEPDGGFFVSVMFPEEANTKDLQARAKERGLMLTDGRCFFADPGQGEEVDGERFVRLPFCAVTPEQIDAGMERLAQIL